MEAKHTPGPWSVDSHFVASINDAEGKPIASAMMMPSERLPSETQAANARLMAAAPDMLEALRIAYGDIQRLPGHTIDMLGRIEAVIAKATGDMQ